MKNNLHVYSEISTLKTVLLHRPGRELENLTPSSMERLLFDDIPYLKIAQKEHDFFAQTLRNQGVEVVYLVDLVEETLKSHPKLLASFVEQFVLEAGILDPSLKEALVDHFLSMEIRRMIHDMMAGIRKSDVQTYEKKSLHDYVEAAQPFLMEPLPNLYFTRDPFATIGNGLSLNRMHTRTRCRETIFAELIFRNHPRFSMGNPPFWFNRKEKTSLEGGDELILNRETLALGISQRTDARSIERLTRNLFKAQNDFQRVLAFEIPRTRAFMHLDTVFTQVDYDKFTIHPEIEGPLTVYELKRRDHKRDPIQIREMHEDLQTILSRVVERDVTLIRCAGGDVVHASREQWNDGSNTLAIGPGQLIVYERNYMTNALLESYGLNLHVIPSSELSRGRGGPRCMSMPLIRE
jgi:arginine deiminase